MKLVSFFIIAIFVMSCSIMTKYPTNRFLPPQMGTTNTHTVQVGSTGAYSVLVASDLDAPQINYDTYSINATNTAFFQTSFGLFDFLNLEIEGGNDLPIMLGARIRAFKWGIFSLGGRAGYGAMMASGASAELARSYLVNVIAQNYEGMIGIDLLDFWKLNIGYYSYLYQIYLEFLRNEAYPGGMGGMVTGFYINNQFKYAWLISNVNIASSKINYGSQTRSDKFLGFSIGAEF